MSFRLNHGKQQTREGHPSRRARRSDIVSTLPAGQGGAGDVKPTIPTTSERNFSQQHHHSRICKDGICSQGIKHEIIQHPASMICFDAVSLCLRLDIVLLQSIRELREAGPWHNELESIYGPLFTSPPTDLFNNIVALRNFPQFEPASIIEQLELRRDNESKARKPEAGRTAPYGQAYECPSANCQRQFKKSGHAQNHVEKQHPEYLKLHHDYQPSQFIVEALRSVSGSPELQRIYENPQPQRPCPTGQRAVSVHSTRLSFPLLEPIDQSLLLSPRSFGLSSGGDWEEQEKTSRSRSHSRLSPRQPVTPQSHEAGLISADRHLAVKAVAPQLEFSQVKRGRDPYSSTESISVTYNTGEQVSAARPKRRHSKRHSMHFSNW